MDSRRRMKGLGVVLGLGLAGCGGGGGLRSFDGAILKVFMSSKPDEGSLSLSVEVTHYGCPSMGETRAFVNGHELEQTDPGGGSSGLAGALTGCNRPTFRSSKTPRELGLDQEVTRFELVDGDVHRLIEGRWLLARRELKWKGPGEPHSPSAGEEVRLEAVGPSGDVLVDEDHWAHALFSGREHPGVSWSMDLTKSAHAERTLSLVAPPFAQAVPGRFIADVLGLAEVIRCEGMGECRLNVHYRLEQELTPSAP